MSCDMCQRANKKLTKASGSPFSSSTCQTKDMESSWNGSNWPTTSYTKREQVHHHIDRLLFQVGRSSSSTR